MNISDIQPFSKRIVDNLEKVIVGKKTSLEMIVTGLLCQGHLLIEDVPGVGKTMVARSLAKSLGCSFKRIQFTPDMLPSDVTGVSIFNQGTREFEFRPGPLMAQIVLVDEINRATPKTQSALLEAMEERQITVDGDTHYLPMPFMVMATQNPIEYEGTFPLPEAQLDRFFAAGAVRVSGCHGRSASIGAPTAPSSDRNAGGDCIDGGIDRSAGDGQDGVCCASDQTVYCADGSFDPGQFRCVFGGQPEGKSGVVPHSPGESRHARQGLRAAR